MDVIMRGGLVTTPAQNAMEGHGLTNAALIIGSDAELYPHLQGRDLTLRAVAYSVYCPATERYSVVTLDGRWVIPGKEGYKSRGAVTTYVRKNGAVLRPEGLVSASRIGLAGVAPASRRISLAGRAPNGPSSLPMLAA
ncbi:hypothetical protein [Streptomyces roseoverticillatus]|uniref:hypothetical protein n=1 Tax=Streptomyces roseoverticillatus TaxID=66429 RepID=UPI0004BEF0B9|nr:hypothetical protein [Streptomyces roseoverticillatus]